MSLLIVPFCSHAGKPNFPQLLEKNGGDDETRTRDLCRDSLAGIGFTTTYKNAGTAKIPVRRTRHHELWVVGWRFAFPCIQEDQSFPNLDLC